MSRFDKVKALKAFDKLIQGYGSVKGISDHFVQTQKTISFLKSIYDMGLEEGFNQCLNANKINNESNDT